MINKILMYVLSFLLLSTPIVHADDQKNRLNELVDQLKGGSCKFEMQGNACVQRPFFASFLRRSDKEQCIIDSANALGVMGPQAKEAVPALIEALNTYRNVDSGDGIIPVRSQIALSLGRIGEPSAIKPLIAVLGSEDEVSLSSSASVPAGYNLVKGASHGAVAEALGMFGAQAKEALPVLNELLAKGVPERRRMEIAVEQIKE